jgi:AcrR family transcriptional regulator
MTRRVSNGRGSGSTGNADDRSSLDRGRRRLTQAERSALSDTRMFNAAMQLISHHGANRTTLKDICETAGYSRGLANYRFGSKDNFLQELLKHFNHAWVDQLRVYTEDKRGLHAFMAAIDALEHFLIEHHRYMRGGYIIWYESIGGDNAIRRQLARNHRQYRHDVEHWLREGIRQGNVRADVDAVNFAVLYLTYVSGTIYQWLVAPEAMDLASAFAYFRGLARRELEPA